MLGRVVKGRSGGKIILLAGKKDCVWVKKNMGVLEVLQLVEEAMGEGIRGRRMWYRLKCNRLELLPLGRDVDVKKLMKGNDEYAYLYATGSEGPCVGRVLGNEACKGQLRGAVVVIMGGVEQLSMLQGCCEEIPEKGRKLMRQLSWRNKLDLKVDKRKMELEKWRNGGGDRIEMKLRKTLGNIGSVADVKLFNTAPGKYGVLLTINRSLVVNLAQRTCSCKWWQLKGLLCAHAMAVIDKQKLCVYDYVSNYYKAATQNMMYMNSIHPMEMHDSTAVDNATRLVVGGEVLDDGYNRRMLLPINPRLQGRPRKR
ncbi:hypothetical protein Cgig2_010918 [Carnegiea gigantea]|uniref:SWIM-type domain-containing protein n=1 Tax=Carnegiea gigantea TaxID=171969 RepID=A0A9Q1QCL2_9CARY|nr:hypothetical protein Cgig2_010918 [Carnegiea gigantea]